MLWLYILISEKGWRSICKQLCHPESMCRGREIVSSYSSCRMRRILALASASSTERCCRLSVRRMLGESPGDWVAKPGGEYCPQSLSCVSSTMVWRKQGQNHSLNSPRSERSWCICTVKRYYCICRLNDITAFVQWNHYSCVCEIPCYRLCAQKMNFRSGW